MESTSLPSSLTCHTFLQMYPLLVVMCFGSSSDLIISSINSSGCRSTRSKYVCPFTEIDNGRTWMSYFSITSCDKSAVESVTILIFAYYILPFPIRSPCYYTSIPIAFNNLKRNFIKLIIFLYLK